MLLEHADVNIPISNYDRRMAVSLATVTGYRRLLIRLLTSRKDAHPKKTDNNGKTPLIGAAESGNNAMIEILLQQDDIILDVSDNDGRTAVSWAAEKGHILILRILLARRRARPDKADNYGKTRPEWAGERGHDAVVRVLLEHKVQRLLVFGSRILSFFACVSAGMVYMGVRESSRAVGWLRHERGG